MKKPSILSRISEIFSITYLPELLETLYQPVETVLRFVLATYGFHKVLVVLKT